MKIKTYYLVKICIILFILQSFCGCNEITNDSIKTIIVGVDIDADYTTIRDAISHAHDNDIILVSEGTYKEVIVLNKTLTLKTKNNANVLLTYNGSLNGSNIILINADNCIVSGFTIINSENDSNVEGIKIDSSGNTIYNNTITKTKYAIHIQQFAEKNNISNNIIRDNYQGIWLYKTNYNYIYKNYIINNSDAGIKARGSTDNIIRRNNFSYNYRGLFICCGTFYNTLYENSFIANSDTHVKGSLKNKWYYDKTGNYWDNYNGYDTNLDNIGDTAFELEGGVASDLYPLYKNLI